MTGYNVFILVQQQKAGKCSTHLVEIGGMCCKLRDKTVLRL